MNDLNESEQNSILESAKEVLKVEEFHLQRALDANDHIKAIHHATLILNGLMRSELSPKLYFDLYSNVSDCLRHLASYLCEAPGVDISEVYKLVQFTPGIFQRLYLMVLVGSVYIKLQKAPAKTVLNDLVEMCHGVQHHLRGLFLRNYLIEVTKDKLPEVGSPYFGEESGCLQDCISFLVKNFTAMNQLWARMKHLAATKNRVKSQIERRHLATLVGRNISILASLEGLTFEIYSASVLPKLLNQIIACQDPIIQTDLIFIIIQTVDAEWHLRSLEKIIKTIGLFDHQIELKSIIVMLLDRIASYLTEVESDPSNFSNYDRSAYKNDAFNILSDGVVSIIQRRPQLPPSHALAMLHSLMSFSFQCYQDNKEQVDFLLDYTSKYLEQLPEDFDSELASTEISRLLRLPLHQYQDIAKVFENPNYLSIINFLSPHKHMSMVVEIVKSVVEFPTHIEVYTVLNKVLTLSKPLLSPPATSPGEPAKPADCTQGYELVACVVHKINTTDLKELGACVMLCKKFFFAENDDSQNANPSKLCLLTSCVFAMLRLVKLTHDDQQNDPTWQSKAQRIFKIITQWCEPFEDATPLAAFKLYIQAALAALECRLADTVDFFVEKALLLYEMRVPASLQLEYWKQIFSVLYIAYPVLAQTDPTTTEPIDYWALLSTNCARSAKSMLTFSDRAIAISTCSHLYWVSAKSSTQPNERDVANVQKSLQFAYNNLSIASTVKADPLPFVHLLNLYLYYLPHIPNDSFRDEMNAVVETVKRIIAEFIPENANMTILFKEAQVFFQNTLKSIENLKPVETQTE
ncbi:vacuolar protein sorting-associated protein 35-like [Schistocerca gregaria]|uniref:vacuolar protein sorting-associated protein 35-like n=1 Tax=Schistocerca gregaria TaxID=7010 RepID=UPI00211DFBA7|nr:vacuolar protein sorting-associated protein 35-like [Schistocerca gregaria]